MLQSAVTCLLWPAEHAIVYGLVDGKVSEQHVPPLINKRNHYVNVIGYIRTFCSCIIIGLSVTVVSTGQQIQQA